MLNSQILNNLRSSYESYSAYYIDDSKTGDFNYEDRFRSNNYLNLKSNIGASWNFELQIESYLPSSLLNYSPDFKNTGISTFNLEYINDKINLKLGNFYEQFGSGMILRSWEDKDLGINNSIRGLNFKYRINDKISLTSLFGQQKKGFKYSKGFIVGLDTEFDFSNETNENYTFIAGLSFVGRNDDQTSGTTYHNTTNLYSARIDFSSLSFYSNIEIINKSKDPVMQFGDFYDDFVEEGAAFFLTQVLLKME